MSDSLWPHESQHARPPCPSSTHGVHSNSCPSSRWCHPAIHLTSHHNTLFFLFLLPLFLSYKDPRGYTGPTQMPYNMIHYRFQELRCGCLWRAVILPIARNCYFLKVRKSPECDLKKEKIYLWWNVPVMWLSEVWLLSSEEKGFWVSERAKLEVS